MSLMGYHTDKDWERTPTDKHLDYYFEKVDQWKKRVRSDHKWMTKITEILKPLKITHGAYKCALNAYPGTKQAMKPLTIYISMEGNRTMYLRRSEKFSRWYLNSYTYSTRIVFSDITKLVDMINEIKTIELISDKPVSQLINRM